MAKSIGSRPHKRLIALLRTVREEGGLTQDRLARALGRQQPWVSKVEAGQIRLDLVELEEWCNAVGVDLIDLIRRFQRR